MERIHIQPRQLKPAEAIQFDRDESERLHVLDPVTQRALPDEGQVVVQSTYWFRRLRDKDVEIVKPEPRGHTSKRASEKE